MVDERAWPRLPLAEWREFYQSVYDAGADLARWDRAALDRPPAEWS